MVTEAQVVQFMLGQIRPLLNEPSYHLEEGPPLFTETNPEYANAHDIFIAKAQRDICIRHYEEGEGT